MEQYTDEIVCPYCGDEKADSWESEDCDGTNEHCGECGEEYHLNVHFEVTYTTHKTKDKPKVKNEKCPYEGLKRLYELGSVTDIGFVEVGLTPEDRDTVVEALELAALFHKNPQLKACIDAGDKATGGEWRYRPDKYDDWGVIRSDDKSIVAVSRSVRMFCANLCRKNDTDPYEANGAFITLSANTRELFKKAWGIVNDRI